LDTDSAELVVSNVSEAWLATALPACEIVPLGAHLQITVRLEDVADVYPFLDSVRLTGASLVSLSITEQDVDHSR
jgi:hypothetical protein